MLSSMAIFHQVTSTELTLHSMTKYNFFNLKIIVSFQYQWDLCAITVYEE